eukprot:gene5889-biopygen1228
MPESKTGSTSPVHCIPLCIACGYVGKHCELHAGRHEYVGKCCRCWEWLGIARHRLRIAVGDAVPAKERRCERMSPAYQIDTFRHHCKRTEAGTDRVIMPLVSLSLVGGLAGCVGRCVRACVSGLIDWILGSRPGLVEYGKSAPWTTQLEKKYVETRRRRRRESGMDRIEQRQR